MGGGNLPLRRRDDVNYATGLPFLRNKVIDFLDLPVAKPHGGLASSQTLRSNPSIPIQRKLPLYLSLKQRCIPDGRVLYRKNKLQKHLKVRAICSKRGALWPPRLMIISQRQPKTRLTPLCLAFGMPFHPLSPASVFVSPFDVGFRDLMLAVFEVCDGYVRVWSISHGPPHSAYSRGFPYFVEFA